MAANKRLANWVLIMLLSTVSTGCFDFCLGGSPDPDPTRDIFALAVQPGTDSLDTVWKEAFRHETYSGAYEIEKALEEGLLSFDPDGHQLLFNHYLYTMRPEQRTAVPDDLHDSQFTHTGEPGRFLVTRSIGKTLYNANYDSVSVQHALTFIETRDEIDEPGTVLSSDTARFISANRYRINRYKRPVLTDDDSRMLYLKSRETREIVVDSSGQVVDDFVFDYTLELHYASLDALNSNDVVIATFDEVTPNTELPTFDLTSDGNFMSYSFGGTVYLYDRSNHSTIELGDGYQPEFSPTGTFVLMPIQHPYSYSDESRKARIYNIDTGEQTVIHAPGGITRPAWHPEKPRVLYFDRKNMYQYRLDTGSHNTLFQFRDYELYRQDNTPNSSVYVQSVFPYKTAGQLYLVGATEVNYYSDDGC